MYGRHTQTQIVALCDFVKHIYCYSNFFPEPLCKAVYALTLQIYEVLIMQSK
jgi:hypothetical protein